MTASVAPLACIVGEPTGMVPALAHKGVYRWRCCVKGHAAHSSLTPQAVNAVEVGARVINKLADMSERWRDHEPRYAGFDVPYSTGAVCLVEGGIADNVVPEIGVIAPDMAIGAVSKALTLKGIDHGVLGADHGVTVDQTVVEV